MFLTRKPTRQDGTKRPGLIREITLTLVAKLLLLYGLWWVFFSDPQLRSMTEGLDPSLVAESLFTHSSQTISNQP